MSVDERDRLALYEEAKRVLSERSAGTLITMLSDLPRPEDMATKNDLAALEARLTDRFRAQTLTLAITMVTSLVGGMAVAAGVARLV